MNEKEKPVIVVVDTIYHKARDVFDAVQDMEIVLAPAGEAPLSTIIRERKAVAVVAGVEKYTGSLYQALEQGGVIARFGVGYDSVDLAKARQNKLLVTNTPGVLESTVAEFTLFLAAEVLRKCGLASQQMKNNQWHSLQGNELGGKTWAIIGLGNIGKKLASMLHLGLGVNVTALSSPGRQQNIPEYDFVRLFSDFHETVAEADIVSIHLPANSATRHYLNEGRLGMLKPGAILINTGRGSLVDENALYDRLSAGRLYGAGIDVYENEPYTPSHRSKDLRRLPNVVLTPHMASNTVECGRRMAARVLQNIRFALQMNYDGMDRVTLSTLPGR